MVVKADRQAFETWRDHFRESLALVPVANLLLRMKGVVKDGKPTILLEASHSVLTDVYYF